MNTSARANVSGSADLFAVCANGKGGWEPRLSSDGEGEFHHAAMVRGHRRPLKRVAANRARRAAIGTRGCIAAATPQLHFVANRVVAGSRNHKVRSCSRQKYMALLRESQ
jgi:hypothetical protein